MPIIIFLFKFKLFLYGYKLSTTVHYKSETNFKAICYLDFLSLLQYFTAVVN